MGYLGTEFKTTASRLYSRRFNAPLSLPSRIPSELHNFSKIKIFRSALRAEMFTSQDLILATQRAHYKGTLQAALQGALQGYTTRATFKISLGFPA